MKSKSGFTLVEVLAVGMILAVLMGVMGAIIIRYNRINNQIHDNSLLENEVNIIETSFYGVVSKANEEGKSLTFKSTENGLFDGETLLIKFDNFDSSYIISSTVFGYKYVTDVIVTKQNPKLLVLTIKKDDKTFTKTYRLIKEVG